ncbi:hypothetical protein V6R86_09440 [Sphingomonas kaistensis]|uniref:Uncharacterized protein n=1 Tax=Sphingomonas kaistensis TaxID=298708 RepID=A0ABZ2G4Z7_9SPHN
MPTVLANLLVALALGQASSAAPTTNPSHQDVAIPESEDSLLLAVPALTPIASNGDVIRYVLRRGFGYGRKPTARIVQAAWLYGSPQPTGLIVELSKADGAWKVIERQEAPIAASEFNRLLGQVAAVTATLGDRTLRGSFVVCSHADSAQFDLSVPDERLRMSRGAHCSKDTSAFVAGEMLTNVVEESLKLKNR